MLSSSESGRCDFKTHIYSMSQSRSGISSEGGGSSAFDVMGEDGPKLGVFEG